MPLKPDMLIFSLLILHAVMEVSIFKIYICIPDALPGSYLIYIEPSWWTLFTHNGRGVARPVIYRRGESYCVKVKVLTRLPCRFRPLFYAVSLKKAHKSGVKGTYHPSHHSYTPFQTCAVLFELKKIPSSLRTSFFCLSFGNVNIILNNPTPASFDFCLAKMFKTKYSPLSTFWVFWTYFFIIIISKKRNLYRQC